MDKYTNEPSELTDNSRRENYSIDEQLFRSGNYSCGKLVSLLEFAARNTNYSIFNNLLIYLQNPDATFYTTAYNWEKMFGRRVAADAKPLFTISSKTPVVLVYDIADTEGLDVPSFLNPSNEPSGFNGTKGKISQAHIECAVLNSSRDRISIVNKSPLTISTVRTVKVQDGSQNTKIDNPKFIIEINGDLNVRDYYVLLCRELAHIYLGHNGTDKDKWWPDREELPEYLKDMEAEAVVYLLAKRRGAETGSAASLCSYFRHQEDIEKISIELIIKTASFFERMSKEILKQRKSTIIH